MSHSHSGGDPVQPINTVQVGEERAHRGRDRDSARSSMQGSRAGTAAEGPWVKTYERGVFLGGVLTFLNWTMLMLSLGSTGWRNFTPVQGVYPAIEVGLFRDCFSVGGVSRCEFVSSGLERLKENSACPGASEAFDANNAAIALAFIAFLVLSVATLIFTWNFIELPLGKLNARKHIFLAVSSIVGGVFALLSGIVYAAMFTDSAPASCSTSSLRVYLMACGSGCKLDYSFALMISAGCLCIVGAFLYFIPDSPPEEEEDEAGTESDKLLSARGSMDSMRGGLHRHGSLLYPEKPGNILMRREAATIPDEDMDEVMSGFSSEAVDMSGLGGEQTLNVNTPDEV